MDKRGNVNGRSHKKIKGGSAAVTRKAASFPTPEIRR